ncbi:MAG: hypothetical protein WCN99_06830 [bacterium]
MRLTREEVLLGFQKLQGQPEQGRKHFKIRLSVEDQHIGTIPIPRPDTFSENLISMVAEPIGLQNADFISICKCFKDLDWYKRYLVQNGDLNPRKFGKQK